MPVYFVYRSFDRGPTGKYLKRFEDDTVLDWFRHHWEHLAIADYQVAEGRLTEVLGCDGWFLWNPFRMAAEEGLPPPQNDEELVDLLLNCMGEDTFVGSPHCLQVFTEEDGEGGALYYFDDHFLKQSGGLATYLLHEHWQLPSGHREGPFVPLVRTHALEPLGSGPGTTYLAPLERESKYPLDNLTGGYHIDGVRLPELAGHVCLMPRDTDRWPWPGCLHYLPALMLSGVEAPSAREAPFLQAVQADPQEAVNWAVWSDWRQERDEEPPGINLLRGAFVRLARLPGDLQENLDPVGRRLIELETQHQVELRTTSHSLIHVEEHLAQMCLDVSWTDDPYFSQWVFFDDLWASAHPDLANAILRFAARWDVLSAD